MTNLSRTFVLIHGAFHGGWCWQKVTPLLRAAGHEVYTPTQTGLGERSHLLQAGLNLDTFINDIGNMLIWEDLNNVVLVGHSFAGITITGLADRMPERINSLIYLDALILQNGQSAFDVIPADVVAQRRQAAKETSGGLTIPVPAPHLFGVTDSHDCAWLNARCTPHPLTTYEDQMSLKNAPGNGLPASYIAVTPHYGPAAAGREYAKTRKDWEYLEMEAAHDAMVSHPTELTSLLLNL